MVHRVVMIQLDGHKDNGVRNQRRVTHDHVVNGRTNSAESCGNFWGTMSRIKPVNPVKTSQQDPDDLT
jgi:hypothetical protein